MFFFFLSFCLNLSSTTPLHCPYSSVFHSPFLLSVHFFITCSVLNSLSLTYHPSPLSFPSRPCSNSPFYLSSFPLSPGETQECLGASVLPYRSPAAPEQPASRANDCGGAAGADEAPPEGTSSRAQEEPQPGRTLLRGPLHLHCHHPALLVLLQTALRHLRSSGLCTLPPTPAQQQ